jgi:radical SAM superfamily enzyme YgiQ (UPF0313 family)
MKPEFSIIIARAPKRRVHVLQSLNEMNVSQQHYEVLIEEGVNPSMNRNRAIGKASGEVLAFVDDDCIVNGDWLNHASAFFDAHGDYDVVGGPQLTPPSTSFFARASGYVLASFFGTYRMSSRYKKSRRNLEAMELNLSSANLFIRKRAFQKSGLFDSRLWPNEETELLCRIANAGGKIAYDPNIVVFHRRRNSLWGLAKQCFRYGTGRARQNKLVGTLLPGLGVTVPCAFLIYLALLPALLILHPLFWVPLLSYCVLNLLVSVGTAWSNKEFLSVFSLPFIFLTVHLSYPLGFLVESTKMHVLRRKLRDIGAETEEAIQASQGVGEAVIEEESGATAMPRKAGRKKMKVVISYPPLESDKGRATLGQNRQFEWYSYPSYIYPMVPAVAATLLSKRGYEVIWNDAIAEGWDYGRFLSFFEREAPDVLALETKTPVVRQHWRIIKELKVLAPQTRIILMGDHVTAFPEESMLACPVDFVLTGGDFDHGLLNICDHLTQGTRLESGIWYREDGNIKDTGPFGTEKRDHTNLPFVDRDLTRWQLYGEHLFYKPSTYTMVGRDCWRPKCTFCSWTTLWPRFRTRSPESLLDEIGMILERYQVREIFDDTGTFPIGAFLRRFCQGVVERGYNKEVYLSCNMRINALRQDDFQLMARAGFRVLKFGIESANQKTLDLLNKGTSVEDLVRGCKEAKAAGLSPHLTTMVGYPWENREDASRTVDLAQDLFDRGYADTIQATVVMPYPGTPLFRQAEENGWLKYGRDWDKYDMTRPVLKTPIEEAEIMDMVKRLYGSFMSPRFIARKLLSIRNLEDVKYYGHAAKVAVHHMLDFKRGGTQLKR